jgi:DNA-binding PadR family transcriptional regulator
MILGMMSGKPRHGYEIIQEARSRGIKLWSRISDISVYKAVDRLEKGGFIEPAKGQGSKQGSRRVFRITPKGEERLSDILFEQLSSEEPLYNEYYLALEFMDLVRRDELELALERRLENLKKHRGTLTTLHESIKDLERESLTLMVERHIDSYEREIDLIQRLITLNREKSTG